MVVFLQDNPYFTQQGGKARWTLSEAEDKRGAGLWVWGLFKDPLYPFLLLQVNNLEIVSVFIHTSFIHSIDACVARGREPLGNQQHVMLA